MREIRPSGSEEGLGQQCPIPTSIYARPRLNLWATDTMGNPKYLLELFLQLTLRG